METLHTLQALLPRLQEAGERLCLLSVRRDASVRWTYNEVADAIHRLANGLLQAGIGRGEHVVLLASNSPEWLIACMAVISAGAVVVPLDTQTRPEALGHILHDSEARFIITTSAHLKTLAEAQPDSTTRTVLLDAADDDAQGWHALLSARSASLPTIEPNDPAALFYTSGTTGTPKGVPLTHRNLTFQIHAVQATGLVTPDERVVMPLPMYHIYAFTVGVLTPLLLHVTVILPQSIAGPHILQAIQEGQASLIIGVPRLYRALYNRIESQVRSRGKLFYTFFQISLALSIAARRHRNWRLGKWLFGALHRQFGPHLGVLASGGSALAPDLAWKLEGLGWQVAIGYGLTETAPILTVKMPTIHPLRLDSVGQALESVDIRIDPEALGEEAMHRTAPADDTPGTADETPTEGEIVVRGPSVFSGYRNLPDQTAAVLTPDGWFRTGDMGYQDEDGYLYISGRVSTLIVTESGKNVQPEPVEEVYQQHPFISEVGILQHDNRLVGLIVPAEDDISQQSDWNMDQAIREAVSTQSKHLASYQRITHYVITSEALPRTNLGKIRRHILAQRYAQAKAEK
jgi:long-chain acyl-CoA synthetase